MKIKWHCRTCNEIGSQDVSFSEVIKIREKQVEPKDDLLVIAMSLVDHICSKPNLGIRMSD